MRGIVFVNRRRYDVPAGDGEYLIDPPLVDVPQLLDVSRQFELPFSWAKKARQEVRHVLGLGDQPRAWFVTGHQPELFHPGVWLKNFVIGQLAERHQGIALNLIVDNDAPKSAAIRLPRWKPGTAASAVTHMSVPFDAHPGDIPFEEWRVRDRSIAESFPARLAAATREWPHAPIGVRTWPSRMQSVPDSLVAVRESQEIKWGFRNSHLKVSQLASMSAFQEFAGDIFDRLAAFHQAYNSALTQYRTLHKIRSRHRPVPELTTDGEWLEAPFWCWTAEEPIRRRPFVRATPTGIQIRVGSRQSAWSNLKFKLRPRALTLTLFVRLALADIFVHGIGGGIYDELTDEISNRFFGTVPPSFMVVTGTLRLPLPLYSAQSIDKPKELRNARDIYWNPQRHLQSPELAAERVRAIGLPTRTREQRRFRNLTLRRNLETWHTRFARQITEAQDRRDRIEAELNANAVLASRDYPWILYSEAQLQEWLAATHS